MSVNVDELRIKSQMKNPNMGMALAFFFGFIGLFYSSPKGSLIMFIPTVVAGVLTAITFGLGIVLFVPITVINCIWANKACNSHNEKLFQNVGDKNISSAA